MEETPNYCGRHKAYDECKQCARNEAARLAIEVMEMEVSGGPTSPIECAIADALRKLADAVLEEN